MDNFVFVSSPADMAANALLASCLRNNCNLLNDASITRKLKSMVVPARQAVFIASPDLKAPMGGHVISFAQRQEAQQFVTQHQLHDVRWLNLTEALAQTGGGSDEGH